MGTEDDMLPDFQRSLKRLRGSVLLVMCFGLACAGLPIVFDFQDSTGALRAQMEALPFMRLPLLGLVVFGLGLNTWLHIQRLEGETKGT
jgi:hypothetical protein